MISRQEIRKLRSYIHKHKHYVNDFGGWSESMNEFPSITEIIKEFMSTNKFEFFNDSRYTTSDKLNFQIWDISVPQHKDQTDLGELFLLCPVEMRKKSHFDFDQSPVFSYIDQYKKRKTEKLVEEDCVVFNPRHNHSVMYQGYDYLIAIVSVKKIH